jgi:hypothetical protein
MRQTEHNNDLLKREKIIATLAAEHVSFTSLLRLALNHGIRTDEGKSKFIEAKFEILNHHENELMLVYKPLQEVRAEKKRAIHSSRVHFDSHRDEITLGFVHTIEMLFNFEECLYSGNIHAETKLMKLIKAISERIAFEESVVFLMYKNMGDFG